MFSRFSASCQAMLGYSMENQIAHFHPTVSQPVEVLLGSLCGTFLAGNGQCLLHCSANDTHHEAKLSCSCLASFHKSIQMMNGSVKQPNDRQNYKLLHNIPVTIFFDLHLPGCLWSLWCWGCLRFLHKQPGWTNLTTTWIGKPPLIKTNQPGTTLTLIRCFKCWLEDLTIVLHIDCCEKLDVKMEWNWPLPK